MGSTSTQPLPRRSRWVERTLGAIAVTSGNPAIVRAELAYLVLFGASAMILVAQAIVAFDAAGAEGVAILTLAQMVPTLLVVPIAAAVGQRFERRRLLLGAFGICTLAAAGTAVHLALDGPFVVLLALAAVLAAATGVAWSVLTAMLPDLARTVEELVGANVGATAAEGVGGLLGPVVATLLLVAAGPAAVTGAAAIALALGLAVTLGVRPPAAFRVRRGRTGGRAFVTELTDGIRVLWSLPAPRLVSAGVVVQTFVRGALGVLMVVLAIELLDMGESGVGLLNAAMGLGGLVGAALTALVMVGRPLGPVLGLALAAWGLPLVLLAPVPSVPAALVAMTVVGVANAFTTVAGSGLLQGSIPDRQRTAGMGAFRSVVSLGMAAGGIAASVLIALIGPMGALAAIGALLPLIAILRWPRFRRLDDQLLVPRDQVAALRACPLFAPMTLAQLEQLAAGSQIVRFPGGHAIVREGEPGDAFYLLTEGTVTVTIGGQTVSTLAPGDGFGEVALLRGSARTATVTTAAAVTAYRVDARTFVGAVCGSTVSLSAAEDRMRGYAASPS